MDQKHPERAGCGASAEPRAEWTAPEVEKLIAGGAQAGPGSDIEGMDGLS